MNSTKLKVGIAGYGVIGRRRHKYIDEHPCLETVAVCDQNFSKDPSLKDSGVKHFDHYKDLLQIDLDILFICMTNDIAPEVTIAALKQQIHVFCEKPPGRTIEDIASVIRQERKSPHLKLKYGFNHRYHDSVRKALQICKSQELGSVINLRGVYGKSKIINYGSNWRTKREVAGGGILLDQGIHMLDLMQLFAGRFSEVHSFVSNEFWQHDVEDNAYALMKTNTNIVALLHSTATQWRHRFNLEITLTKGMIILSGILSGSKSYGAETITVVKAEDDGMGDPEEQTTLYTKDLSWKHEINDFYKNVSQDLPVDDGSSKDALETMALVYKIYCSDEKWKNKFDLNCEIPNDI